MYGASLDFSTILLSSKSGLSNRAFTVAVPIAGRVFQVLNCGTFEPDDNTLIHELAHAWQSQHHANKFHYMVNAVRSQAAAVAANTAAALADPMVMLNRDFPLFYPFDAYAYPRGTAFSALAAEQMAAAIERGATAIVAHVRSVGMNAVDPSCVTALSSPRIADRRLRNVI